MQLEDWLSKHGSLECKVTFGSEIGQYTAIVEKKRLWRNVGLYLPDWIMSQQKTLKYAAMGISGSCVFIYTDGTIAYACDKDYPELEKILKAAERGDVVVSTDDLSKYNEDPRLNKFC